MNPGLFSLALLGVCVAHAAGGDRLAIAGVQPDLFLILAVGASLGATPEAGAGMGFLTGLYQDTLSGGPLGLRAFTLTLMAYAAARLTQSIQTSRPLAQFALLLGGVVVAGAITLTTMGFFFGLPPLRQAFLHVLAPETLVTAGLGTALLAAGRAWRVARAHAV